MGHNVFLVLLGVNGHFGTLRRDIIKQNLLQSPRNI